MLSIKSRIYWHSIKLKSSVIISSHITLSPAFQGWLHVYWNFYCWPEMTLPLFIIRFVGLSFLPLLFSFPFLCLWQFNLIYLCSSSKATNELLFALCRFYAKTFDLSLFVLCLIDFLLLLFRTPHRLLMPQGIKNSLYCDLKEIWTEAVLKHSFIALKLRKRIVCFIINSKQILQT